MKTQSVLVALLFFITSSLYCLDAEQIDRLIRTFSPLLKLHDNEIGFPCSVDWYLQRCSLHKRTAQGSEEIEKVGKITAAILGDLPNEGQDYYLKPADPKNTYKGEPIIGAKQEIVRGEVRTYGGTANVPCYAHVVERDNGNRIIIQYMFFYPYQGPLPFIVGLNVSGSVLGTIMGFLKKQVLHKIGIHVGDWEHTDVYVTKQGNTGDVAQDYVLSQVFFARHQQRKGDLLAAEQVTKVNDKMREAKNGTHVVVWVAKHSHAGYPSNIGFSTDVDTTSNLGPRWPTWNTVKNVGTPEHPAPGMEWIKAKELRWGDTVAESIQVPGVGAIEYHGNSPTTPSSGGWFLQPDIKQTLIETRIAGKRVNEIPFSLDPYKGKDGKGFSKYFSIEIPKRFKQLKFVVEHPNIEHFNFDIWEYKYGRSNQKIYEKIQGPVFVVDVPYTTVIKNLYIDNVRLFDAVDKNVDAKLQIYGIED